MKKILLSFFLLFSFSVFAEMPDRPSPPRLVNDLASMLSAEEISSLEKKLDDYNDSTSTQICIVTVNNLDGDEAGNYAFMLGDKWGIGRKQKDNGVLILISKETHDAFIATGRGMEGAVTDVHCKRIIENIIVPNFKDGKYYDGLSGAVDAIIKLAAGEFVNDVSEDKKSLPFSPFIPVVIIIIIAIAARRKRNNRGGGGGYIGRGGYFPTYWGGGSSWGGGGFSGGGGGFGGFGGGSFGGGGAGGKW